MTLRTQHTANAPATLSGEHIARFRLDVLSFRSIDTVCQIGRDGLKDSDCPLPVLTLDDQLCLGVVSLNRGPQLCDSLYRCRRR